MAKAAVYRMWMSCLDLELPNVCLSCLQFAHYCSNYLSTAGMAISYELNAVTSGFVQNLIPCHLESNDVHRSNAQSNAKVTASTSKVCQFGKL